MDRRGYRGSAGVLAWLGYALLLVGWLAATPPFQAPDEVSHYVRTWGLADGQVLGLAPQPPTPPADVANDPARLASFWWAFETTTFVSMPEHLVPQSRDCARNAAEPATCVDLAPETRQDRRNVSTNTGTTSPTSVAAPAALVRLGDSDTEALAWARVGGLLGVLATLGVTLLALAPLGRRVLPGLALGLTPMAVYLGAVLNPSGQEVPALQVEAGVLVAEHPERCGERERPEDRPGAREPTRHPRCGRRDRRAERTPGNNQDHQEDPADRHRSGKGELEQVELADGMPQEHRDPADQLGRRPTEVVRSDRGLDLRPRVPEDPESQAAEVGATPRQQ